MEDSKPEALAVLLVGLVPANGSPIGIRACASGLWGLPRPRATGRTMREPGYFNARSCRCTSSQGSRRLASRILA